MGYMAITDDDRDAAGRIIVRRSLADLLPAEQTGETVQDHEQTGSEGWRPGRAEIAGLIAGLLLAAALIAAMNTFFPAPAQGTRYPIPTAAAPPPTARPAPTARPTIAPIQAYAEAGGALLGTIPATATIVYRDSRHGGWGGVDWRGSVVWIRTARDLSGLPDLAPPTPRPAPTHAPAAPVFQPPSLDEPCDPEVNPRYRSPLRVDPIGSVVGVSCSSQAEADSNALMLADQLRADAR